jgi:hypothetical protein
MMHSDDAGAQEELSRALRGGKNSLREIKSLNRTPLVVAKAKEETGEGKEGEEGGGHVDNQKNKKKTKKKIRQIRRRLTSSRGGKRAGSGENPCWVWRRCSFGPLLLP